MGMDDYAKLIIAEGQRLGIRPIGIVIGLAVPFVECNYKMLANPKVPESLNLPNEGIGTDGKSVGLYQQQIVWGNNGWWWGDAATCMDPTLSARLFFKKLAKDWRYWENDVSPGWYAQQVQDSAYPDRYDERMDEAQALYDRLVGTVPSKPTPPAEQPVSNIQEIDKTGESRNFSSRYGAAVRLWILHTEEGNSDAFDLHEWMKRNGVSYHYVGANGIVIDHVDTDYASWSALDANNYSINFVFAGSKARYTRQEWLANYADEIDYAAKLFVQDAEKYGPLVPVVLGQDYVSIGNGSNGAIDHSGVTFGLGIGDHTDVGKNFPWDVFEAAVEKWLTGVTIPTVPIVNAIDEAAAQAAWLGARITVGETTCPDGRGRYAQFENGFIHWTPSTGARPMPMNIFQAWESFGYESGPLGYPINYHSVLPAEAGATPVGDVQAFEGGTIYRKYGQDGYYVHGAIGNRWSREGYEKSSWGWPVSNEISFDGGAYQDFEGGRITWSADGTLGLSPQVGPDTIVAPVHT